MKVITLAITLYPARGQPMCHQHLWHSARIHLWSRVGMTALRPLITIFETDKCRIAPYIESAIVASHVVSKLLQWCMQFLGVSGQQH